ncbi:MAG: hypothetical protein AAB091_07810 [Elusimicrobiota bacterium]
MNQRGGAIPGSHQAHRAKGRGAPGDSADILMIAHRIQSDQQGATALAALSQNIVPFIRNRRLIQH